MNQSQNFFICHSLLNPCAIEFVRVIIGASIILCLLSSLSQLFLCQWRQLYHEYITRTLLHSGFMTKPEIFRQECNSIRRLY